MQEKSGTNVPNTDWCNITGETCDMHVEESLDATHPLLIDAITQAQPVLCRNKESLKSGREDLVWEEVSTEHIVQDEWIDFRRSAYRLPDGNVFEPFYSFSRRDYVVIVASDCDGNYLCVRQFRHGIREVTTEFPAGGLERSDGKEYRAGEEASSSEDSLDAARRELLEETGYTSSEWTHLITLPSCATIADNYAYVYMAKNCRRVSGQELDETEFLNVELYTEQEMEELIHTGRFQQAVHVMAWLLAKEKGADT